MQLFLFNHVTGLTNRYHSGGGMVIVARNRDRAQELVAAHYASQEFEAWETRPEGPTAQEWEDAILYQITPHATEKLYIFPDAGCC